MTGWPLSSRFEAPARPFRPLPKGSVPLRRVRHILLVVAALAALAATPAAAASGGWRQALRDCAYDGRLHQHYSQSDLLQALRHLPPDINEYTDCYDVLRSALAGPGASGFGAGGSSGGTLAPTPSDIKQVTDIAHGPAPKVDVGGHPITPGPFSLASRTASNRLPPSLMWTLIGLACVTALAGVVAVRRRLPGVLRVLRRR
jgi:hypothetical protein